MNDTLRQWGLVIIVTIILLMGCEAIHKGALKPADMSTPKENEEAKQTAARETPVKEVDVNFIPASRLSIKNINDLWTVATNKCYDFRWSIANNDKTTRNLICQTQSSGGTLTLLVKFADEGVYVDLQMSTEGWALFGGKEMASKIKEHIEMKKALQDALSKVQYRTPAMTSQPAAPQKSQKSITPAQAKTESSPPSMTTAQIQQRLSELGYQPGPADGKIGKSTIKALKNFQQDNNLPITGKADNETVNKLRQKTAKDNKE